MSDKSEVPEESYETFYQRELSQSYMNCKPLKRKQIRVIPELYIQKAKIKNEEVASVPLCKSLNRIPFKVIKQTKHVLKSTLSDYSQDLR